MWVRRRPAATASTHTLTAATVAVLCMKHRTYRVHPHLLAHLASDVAQALHAVDALRLEAAVPKHAQHLRVLCRWTYSTRAVQVQGGFKVGGRQPVALLRRSCGGGGDVVASVVLHRVSV